MVGLQRPADQHPAGLKAELPRFVVTGSPSPSPPDSASNNPRMAGVSKSQSPDAPRPPAAPAFPTTITTNKTTGRSPAAYLDFEPPRSARPIRSARPPPLILAAATNSRTVAAAPPTLNNRPTLAVVRPPPPIYLDFEPARSARPLRSARPRSGRIRVIPPLISATTTINNAANTSLFPYGNRPASPVPPPDPIQRPSSRPPPRTERSSQLRVPDGKSPTGNQLLPSLGPEAPRWNFSTSTSSSSKTLRATSDLRRQRSASRLAAYDRSSSETDVRPVTARMNLASRGRNGRLRSTGHLDETSFTIADVCRTNSVEQKNNETSNNDDLRLVTAGPTKDTGKDTSSVRVAAEIVGVARCSPSLLRARLALLGRSPSVEAFDDLTLDSSNRVDARDFGIRDFLNADGESLDTEDESSLAGDFNIGLGLQPPRFSVDSFDAQLSTLLEMRENDDALLPLWSADRTAVRAIIRRCSEDVSAMQRARRPSSGVSGGGGGEGNDDDGSNADALNHGTNGESDNRQVAVARRPAGRLLRKSFSLPHAMVVVGNSASVAAKTTLVHRNYGSANITSRMDSLSLGMKTNDDLATTTNRREPLKAGREANTIDELDDDDADWVMDNDEVVELKMTPVQGNGQV